MVEAFVQRFRDMSTSRLISFGALVAILISAIVVLVLWMNKTEFQVLYSNLSEDDAAKVVEMLRNENIEFEIGGGGVISVPNEIVHETRLRVAAAGLPKGAGVGFEIFDKSGFGVTEFVQKVNYTRALQGELARTISVLNEVDTARVHIVTPKKRLFSSENDLARASVVLKFVEGGRLNPDQINGVVNLVASSIDGLNHKNVTIVDTSGRLLSGDGDEDSSSNLSSTQFEYQKSIEKLLVARIQSILEPVVGKEKVMAKVSADIDFTRAEMTEEKFDPESVVVRSEQTSKEKTTNGAAGGVPGVASNVPGEQLPADGSDGGGSEKQNETINYEISKIVSKTVLPTGVIKRLSVAVLVDGTYKITKDEEGMETKTYQPWQPGDLKKFQNLVKGAVGVQSDRGDTLEVVNIPFETQPVPEKLKISMVDKFLPLALRYGTVLIVSLLLLIFVVKPIVKALFPQHEPEAQFAGGGAGMMGYSEEDEDWETLTPETKKKMSIRGMVKKNPQQSAAILKSWLKDQSGNE